MADVRRRDLSILIVSWNCRGLLENCLASLARHVTMDHEVLVVDNASADDTAAMVRGRFPAVRLVELPENVGFARGNNAALDAAQGDCFLLLNPDTEVRPGAVESLVQFLTEHPRAGICAPPLWDPDGSRQRSVLSPPTLAGELLRHTMLHRVLPHRARSEARRLDTRPVEAVSGAALCVRRQCAREIGPLDPDFFMFFEDVDWCRRARGAGWEVWYADGPGIVHVKSGTSVGPARTRTLIESLRSTMCYFRKHEGGSRTAAMRAIAVAGAIARSVRAGLLWVVGHDRPDQRARLAAYVRILRWGLLGGDLHAPLPAGRGARESTPP